MLDRAFRPSSGGRGETRAAESGTGAAETGIAPLPPGPRTPGAFQTIDWLLRPAALLERSQRRYGNVFKLSLGPAKNVAVIADPMAAKALIKADPEHCRAGDTNGVFRNVVGDSSILVLDGAEHMEQRRLMLPAFGADHVSAFASSIENLTLDRIRSWPIGTPFTLQEEMEVISFETIMMLAFGNRLDQRHEELRRLIPDMMDRCASPILMLPWFRQDLGGLSPAAKARRVIREIDHVLFDLISERRADPLSQLQGDVISMLSRAKHEDGAEMTDQEIRDEVLTLLMAGYETTTSALAWAFERLLRSDQVLERLLGELEADEDEYLDAVVKEVLRIRPVVPVVARRLRAPLELAGYTFPAGWILMACIHLVHRDPSVYPDPEAFRPERFLPGAPEPEAWIPFGGGVRRCLGASLAQLEIKVVLRTVLRTAALRRAAAAAEPPVRRRFTFAPRHHAEVVVDSIDAQALPPGRFAPRRAREGTHTTV